MWYFLNQQNVKTTIRRKKKDTKMLLYVCTYLPVCKNRWFLRFVCFEKPLEHMWHLKGHEPLWTYMCDFKSPGVGNDFEQRPHLCGFSCNKEKKKKIFSIV